MPNPTPQFYAPPQSLVPIVDPSWTRWLTETVWPIVGKGVGKGPQGTFPQLQIDEAVFSVANGLMQSQDLLTVNKGIYSNYFSGKGGILYGFACNVHRSSGTNFVVAAQLNAWAEKGVSCPVFGLATTALTMPGSSNCGITGYELNSANSDDANTAVKQGMISVWKDRPDGQAAVTNGLGANKYNWTAMCYLLDSAPRSSSGEFCGWNIGIMFLDGWCDQDNPTAWSSTQTYQRGQTATSGGVVYISIIGGNLNNNPPASPTAWLPRTYAGTNNLAVGIDFSTMSTGSMARMASAIRLRNLMYFHWEESGAVGTRMNGGTGNWELTNQGGFRFGVNVTSGIIQTGNAANAVGAGATATLGKIGAPGPAGAAQVAWLKITDGAGATYQIPLWQ